MLDILKFVLGDFWVFVGTVILIYDVGLSVSMIVSAVTGNGGNYTLIDFAGGKGEKVKKATGGAKEHDV